MSRSRRSSSVTSVFCTSASFCAGVIAASLAASSLVFASDIPGVVCRMLMLRRLWMPAVTEPSTCTSLCLVSPFLSPSPFAVVVSELCAPLPDQTLYAVALSYACV